MRNSMRKRLIIIIAAIIFFTLVCIFITNVFLLPGFYQMQKVSQMSDVYDRAGKLCEDIDWEKLSDDKKNDLYDKLDSLGSDFGVNLYILQISANSTSKDIANINYVYPTDSDRLKEVTKNQLGKYVRAMYFGESLSENCKLLKETKKYTIYNTYDERVDGNFIELTGQFPDNYWLYVRANYQSIKESTRVSNVFLMYVGGVVLIISIIVMVIVANRYTRPILKLAKHAEKMRGLDFSTRYDEDRDDEIGVLGRSMNELSDKLEDTISELKTANTELKRDIQKKSEQEKMRQDFLANVSHELKTPISLIQGYAEGLMENVNDDENSRNFYCEVIMDEADKMNNMVKRLLSLNQLEFGVDQVHMEHFDINELIVNVVRSNEIVIKQKDVRVLYSPADEPVMVWGDEYMIDEVVTNYLSNALNHVQMKKSTFSDEKLPNEESIIEIKHDFFDDKIRISIFNTGLPIPDEDIEKIWDKFYKADKARTREYGGNGIGLSIVKAIMEAHGNEYGVRNYDNGVEFWFELETR